MRSRTNAHRTTYQCELLLQIEANGPALLLKDDAPAAYLADSLFLVESSVTQAKAPQREPGPRHDP